MKSNRIYVLLAGAVLIIAAAAIFQYKGAASNIPAQRPTETGSNPEQDIIASPPASAMNPVVEPSVRPSSEATPSAEKSLWDTKPTELYARALRGGSQHDNIVAMGISMLCTQIVGMKDATKELTQDSPPVLDGAGIPTSKPFIAARDRLAGYCGPDVPDFSDRLAKHGRRVDRGYFALQVQNERLPPEERWPLLVQVLSSPTKNPFEFMTWVDGDRGLDSEMRGLTTVQRGYVRQQLMSELVGDAQYVDFHATKMCALLSYCEGHSRMTGQEKNSADQFAQKVTQLIREQRWHQLIKP